jgi:hypothetical protein
MNQRALGRDLETGHIMTTQALVRQNTLETAVNRTVDLSTQAVADSGGNLIFHSLWLDL